MRNEPPRIRASRDRTSTTPDEPESEVPTVPYTDPALLDAIIQEVDDVPTAPIPPPVTPRPTS